MGPAPQPNVVHVSPQLLTASRKDLITERLDAIKSGIIDGQYLPAIDVKPLTGGFYPVVNGNHRLAIARELELETVPVLIVGE